MFSSKFISTSSIASSHYYNLSNSSVFEAFIDKYTPLISNQLKCITKNTKIVKKKLKIGFILKEKYIKLEKIKIFKGKLLC